MMLGDLSMLLDKVPVNAKPNDYLTAIIEDNLLGKRTQTTRQRTAQRLSELYALDPKVPIFALLRQFWKLDPNGRPMLAFLSAAARDSLLRETTPFLLSKPSETRVFPTEIGEFLDEKYPRRFQSSTRLSTAQNLASSWAQAGYLKGKVRKIRSKPNVTPIVGAFALMLGYVCGLRGRLLLTSTWAQLLDRSSAELSDVIAEASRQGWVNYKAAGSIVEITFPKPIQAYELSG